MRKLWSLFLIVMALGLLAAPAAAIPTADLAALARYVDADTQVFASIRTDDGYIDTLDGLLTRIEPYLPAGMPVEEGLRDALDRTFSDATGQTFDELTDSWLGDTAAIMLKNFDVAFDNDLNNDDEIPVIIALETTDRAAAVDFFSSILLDLNMNMTEPGSYTLTEEAAYSLFIQEPEFGQPTNIYIDDGAILISPFATLFPTGGLPVASLADSPTFTDAIAQLPNGDYNILFYLDSVGLLANVNNQLATMNPADAAALESSLAALEALGAQVWGFTILDDRSLTIDIAQLADYDALAAQSGVLIDPADLPTFDPAFAAYIPAGTPLVVQGAGLGLNIDAVLNNLEMQADTLAPQLQITPDELLQGVAQIEFAVQGFTGLDLREEILPWMNGQYALWLSVNPALADVDSVQDVENLPVLPADGALLIATDDPTATAEFVTGLQTTLDGLIAPDFPATLTTESIGGGTAIVLTVLNQPVNYPVEFLIASNDEVLAIGTRQAVTYALTQDGPALLTDPLYEEALAYALPNSTAFAYAAGGPLQPLVPFVQAADNSFAAEANAANLRFILDLFYNSSLSGYATDTASVFRAVLTLPE